MVFSLAGLVEVVAVAGTLIPPAALAAFSLAVLLLVLDHRRANLGGRATLVFLFGTVLYGLVRSVAIRALAEAHLGGMPYRLRSPLVAIAGVPLQELIGWTAALGLSAYLADRLLRRLGQSTDAFRSALAAGLAMTAVCLAVETAAVVGGWWGWSLAHSTTGPIRFPWIALVDWGFVAIDFLLPFELWQRRAPLAQRLASLLLFPVHLAGHAFAAPIPGPLPLSGFDLVHVGLVAAVVAAHGASPWPVLGAERRRLYPVLAASLLLGTAAAQLVLAREPSLLWTGLPLAALVLLSATIRREPPVWTGRLTRSRALALFAGLLTLGLALRLPSAFRARDFERLLRHGAEQLVVGRAEGARGSLQRALELRPGHSEALWLLGWADLQLGQRAEARRHLEAALASRPESKEAARLLAELDRVEGRSGVPVPP